MNKLKNTTTENNQHQQLCRPHGRSCSPTMGGPQRKHANNHAVGRMRMNLLFLFRLIFIIANVDPILRHSTTMVIATCSLNTKEKPACRALVTIAPSPMKHHQEQRSKRLSKSPRANNVNTLLAEINRPAGHLDNFLQALGPSKDPANKVNHSAPKNNKNKHATPLESPTGVDQEPSEALVTNQETKV